MSTQTFLVEIGTEELPPKALKNLSETFASGIEKGLQNHGLQFGKINIFATPRRLAVMVESLENKQPDNAIEKLGPAVSAAFDSEGKPTKPAEGFARGFGVDVADLTQVETDKGLRLAYKTVVAGKDTIQLLPDVISKSLADLPIPKRMRWGSSRAEFVRPVHWLVMLFGSAIVDCDILGVKAGRTTRGHRFHYNTTIDITKPEDYQTTLREPGFVVADFSVRKAQIEQLVNAQAKTVDGTAIIDAALLDEVTGLVEWPVALTGRFEERFLLVPSEALISSMKEHQKYFHVVDQNGKLLPYFITIANIASVDPTQVINGNERVIRPRLADAAFFFETDKKISLQDRREKLRNIIFQAELGTLYDKTLRVAKLARAIATKIGSDPDLAERAAFLSKSDLVSDMVLEFADLQGIMGYYYAVHDNEHTDVAKALNEQYLPKFAGDELPATTTGICLALADRIDTLVGIFGIGQPPTGSKDPFALRRASLGVLRIIVEKQLTLDLRECIKIARENYGALVKAENLIDSTLTYMIERFRNWFEEENIAAEVFMSVAAKQLSEPNDINRRVHAVEQFTRLPEAVSLAAANKRVSNILNKQEHNFSNELVNPSLFESDVERILANAVETATVKIRPLLENSDYTAALASLASLREPIDNFFDHVMVMAEDLQIRKNRLTLLAKLRYLFLEVADISLLAPAK